MPLKIVVFDLDETLGSFGEVGMFWDALHHQRKATAAALTDADFFALMDLFPGFLRPNIIKILAYLVEQKQAGLCDRVMIYTNNQGPKSWAVLISRYLNQKVGYALFDQIIAAFKVKGRVVEVGRTTQDKCLGDLIRCTQIPANTQICFLDDLYHPLMQHDNVFYINVKPYHFSMPYLELAQQYSDNRRLDANRSLDATRSLDANRSLDAGFVPDIVAYMSRYNYTVVQKDALEQSVDLIVSKKILLYLVEFFKSGPPPLAKPPRRLNKTR